MPEPKPPRKKVRRRRRENVAGGRPFTHRVRVDEHEEAVLARLAAEQHVTVPRLLVESALSRSGDTPSARREALRKLFAMRRQLAGIATNINQLAKVANTDGHVPVGTADALARLRVLAVKIEAAVDEVGRP